MIRLFFFALIASLFGTTLASAERYTDGQRQITPYQINELNNELNDIAEELAKIRRHRQREAQRREYERQQAVRAAAIQHDKDVAAAYHARHPGPQARKVVAPHQFILNPHVGAKESNQTDSKPLSLGDCAWWLVHWDGYKYEKATPDYEHLLKHLVAQYPENHEVVFALTSSTTAKLRKQAPDWKNLNVMRIIIGFDGKYPTYRASCDALLEKVAKVPKRSPNRSLSAREGTNRFGGKIEPEPYAKRSVQ